MHMARDGQNLLLVQITGSVCSEPQTNQSNPRPNRNILFGAGRANQTTNTPECIQDAHASAQSVPPRCSCSSTQSTQRIHYFIHAECIKDSSASVPRLYVVTAPSQRSTTPDRLKVVARRIGRTKDRNNRCAKRISKMQTVLYLRQPLQLRFSAVPSVAPGPCERQRLRVPCRTDYGGTQIRFAWPDIDHCLQPELLKNLCSQRSYRSTGQHFDRHPPPDSAQRSPQFLLSDSCPHHLFIFIRDSQIYVPKSEFAHPLESTSLHSDPQCARRLTFVRDRYKVSVRRVPEPSPRRIQSVVERAPEMELPLTSTVPGSRWLFDRLHPDTSQGAPHV